MRYVDPADDVNVLPYIKHLLGKWRLIIGFSAACGVLSALLTYIVSPWYEAEVVVMPVNEETSPGALGALAEQFGSIASLAGIGISAGGMKETALALLQSKNLMVQFIQERDLLPILFDDLWDKDKKQWNVSDPSDVPTVLDGVEEMFDEVMDISEDSDIGTITLTIKWKNRDQAADWANALIKLVNEKMRTEAIREAETNISYLNRELSKTSVVPLKTAIYSMIEAEVRNRMLANVRGEFALKTIDMAIPPDEDDYYFPNRPVLTVLGTILGALFLVSYILIRHIVSVMEEDGMQENLKGAKRE